MRARYFELCGPSVRIGEWTDANIMLKRCKHIAASASVACVLATAMPAHAQFTGNYVDTNPGVLSSGATPCNAALVRTITVTDAMTITDVDLGMIIDHDNRGDTAAAIRSPAGTQVLMYFGTGGTLNDYNVLFDQAAAGDVDTGAQNVNNNVAATPYQFDVQPTGANTLNDFNGEQAQGNWLFLACDNSNNGIDGQYLQSELIVTGTQNFADLSLTIVPDDPSTAFGSNVTLTLTVELVGDQAATGVAVDFQLPSGLDFVSSAGTGTYNDASGTWSVGNIGANSSVSIDIVAEVLSTGTHSSVGEISVATANDPDSTPGNAGTDPTEDDTASFTLTPAYGGGTGPSGEPNLSCVSPESFDWDINSWPAGGGSLSQSYPTGGSDNTSFDFAFTGDTGRRGNNSPETNTDMQGGLTPAQDSLYYWQNLSATTESVDLTIDVGTPGTGVQDLQFTVFDFDFAAGQFRDRLAVQGFLNGTPVTPVLTPGSANQQIGSIVFGTTANDNAEAGGNIIVTFLAPVDQVVLNYGNTEASTGTSNQAMAVHDLNYCPRATDFGDIASTYGNASHMVQAGYQIGATAPDGESGTQTSANADGDDVANADDEDTIDFSALVSGQAANLSVNVTGSGGFLQMWIDWNGDGDFGDSVDGVSEQVASDLTITGTSGAASIPITVPANATLSQTFARLRWSSQSGLSPSGAATDGEVEDHALTITGAPSMHGNKTMQIYDPTGLGLYAIPGNDVIYTITVSNSGFGPTDPNSVVLIDAMPSEVEFFNGDIDTGGPDTFPGSDPVGFTQANGAALTLDYATNVAFSDAATPPTDFSECGYSPDLGYDPDVTFICFNPQGALGAGDPDPEFSVSFRARIQ